MPYVILEDDGGIVEVSLTGPARAGELRQMTTDAINLQKRAGATRFLIDTKEWGITAHDMEIYTAVTEQYQKEGLSRGTLVAIIAPASPSARGAAMFYEDVSQVRGWDVRMFPDRQAAIGWLKGDGKKIE